MTALSSAEFADLMRAFEPFERAPHLAVACSGGGDSLALTLLADEWARARGGRVTALIVDHGLRPGSAEEAKRVSGWLSGLGIEGVVLVRTGAAPASNLQAAARRARYALLRGWCREAGVLHLMLAQHRRDQAETLMLRLARGSGVDGLAAMAPVSELAEARLLRPLLDVPPARLAALLAVRRQLSVEDPSNENREFARVRMRGLLPALAREGADETRLAATAGRLARARTALESAATELLAEIAEIYPQGYAVASSARLLAAPEEVGLRALARLLACIGGAEYAARLARLERLYGWLRHGAGVGRTLAGCRIMRRGGRLLICREASAVGPAQRAADGIVWDGRFRLTLGGAAPECAVIGPLGNSGWAQLRADRAKLDRFGLPGAVRTVLPALWDLDGVLAVPHLSYRRDGAGEKGPAQSQFAFQPAHQLGGAAFAAGAALA